MQENNSKRIFKNTVYLYIRMFVSLAISIYTSRIVLNTLGASDYGIYGVVGSVVVLFVFLNITLSSATSRFISFQLGRGKDIELKETFNSAIWLHAILAVILFFLAETIGLWFLNNKLIIPANRMEAANWVFQFSILASMISVIQVPFNAVVISHEKMDFYAYVDICFSISKLLIVYALVISKFDKLIFYAALTLFCHFLFFLIYFLYCRFSFRECRFSTKINRSIIKSMLSFSSWTLYSSLCFTTRHQGTNILLNIFGGTIVNAAAGLASTSLTIIERFATNIVMASRPQIIKTYACEDYKNMLKLLKQTHVFANLLFLIVAIPFVAERHYILTLWLKNVPLYLEGFCVLLIIGAYITLNNNVIHIAIQASGDIRAYSLLAGTTSVMVIPVTYFLFRMGFPLYTVYALPIATNFMIYTYSMYILNKLIYGVHPINYIFNSFINPTLCGLPAILILLVLFMIMPSNFLRLILSITISITTTCLMAAYFVLTKEMRQVLIRKVFVTNKLRA